MHLFVSAGEPSGDLHGSNLIGAIRARNPGAQVSAFGGDRMRAAGAELLFPLTDLAVMWFGRALANLPTFFRVATLAEEYFRTDRPDAVVLIDYPGFHWHIAKRAHRAGIPVYYFVPPQLWAWAGWRVRKMRKWVDCVLTALPFEDEWYRARGVRTHYVGHPYFDELGRQRLDGDFIADQWRKAGPVVALLPGSRNQEVAVNFPLIVAAAKRIHASRPDVRFLVASFNDRQASVAREMLTAAGLVAEVHIGRTPEIIELGTASLAVSGSVGLELMYRLTPTVVAYKVSTLFYRLAQLLKTCRYISLVNLLAGAELFPEFASPRDNSEAMAGHVLNWLNNPAERAVRVAELEALKGRVAIPGACDRASAFLAERVATRTPTGRRAAA
jgi:lipid-A-disaccharide synthase